MENPKEGLSSVKLTTTALCILALSGCISPQMKTSMDDYGQVFSDASNRQLLLNLARMDQGQRHLGAFLPLQPLDRLVLDNSPAHR